MPSRRPDFRRRVIPPLAVVLSALSCARIFGFREGELLPPDGDDAGRPDGSGGAPDTGGTPSGGTPDFGGAPSDGGQPGGAGFANTAGEGGSPAGRGGSSPAGRGGSRTGGYAGGAGGCLYDSDCENPDGDHCAVSCTNSACSVLARDWDGDGHGDASCAAAPGYDCDDSVGSIHPGVAEACDGLDNNCNGTIDSDGFPTKGQSCTKAGGGSGTQVCNAQQNGVICQ